MSVTVEIPEGYYSLQLGTTKPGQLTGLYASDNGIGNQILLKSSQENFQGQAWFISPSPVKTETNVYLITKYIPSPDTPGFGTPDTNLSEVVLDVPKKWFFDLALPDIYMIRPVEHPIVPRIGHYLASDANKNGVVIETFAPIEVPSLPAWEVRMLPIDGAQ